MLSRHIGSLAAAQAVMQAAAPASAGAGASAGQLTGHAAPTQAEQQAVQEFVRGQQHVVGLHDLILALLERTLGAHPVELSQATQVQLLRLQSVLQGERHGRGDRPSPT